MKHSVDILVLQKNSTNVDDDDNDEDIYKPKHLEDCNEPTTLYVRSSSGEEERKN